MVSESSRYSTIRYLLERGDDPPCFSTRHLRKDTGYLAIHEVLNPVADVGYLVSSLLVPRPRLLDSEGNAKLGAIFQSILR